jgi:predicted lipoprotein with Yx(FWY)xxD motif
VKAWAFLLTGGATAAVALGPAHIGAAAVDTTARTSSTPSALVKAAYNKSLKATILVDGAGRTLYLFSSDPKNLSTCAAVDPTCPKIWPAYTTSGKPIAGTGVKAALLGITAKKQVTYDGHPLYHFARASGYGAPDKKAGQANGQGLFQAWYVVSPKGTPIRK